MCIYSRVISRFKVSIDMILTDPNALTFVCCLFFYSNTDKPDASAVMLHDFQRFLVYDQKVITSNRLFVFTFLLNIT